MKVTKRRMEECRQSLLEILPPGDTVYTSLRHVSRSGMYHVIRLAVIRDNSPRDISRLAADLLEGWDNRWEGCKAGGCGMDMGFHLVYYLSHALFPDGFNCIGEDCPSNDHNNAWYQIQKGVCPVCGGKEWARDDKGAPKYYRIRHAVCSADCVTREWKHESGGYTLKHKWI